MQAFDNAGIAVYALSYDEQDALRDFASAHSISYKLLSDPDSQVIRSFGILNTLIDPSDPPWYGIPYPGTYVLDQDGKITHKFFDSNLAVRAGPEQLIRAALGQQLMESNAEAEPPESVQVSVALDGTELARTVQRDVVVTFRVPPGRHVYAQPAPQGSVPVDVILDDNELLALRPLLRPDSETHSLTGTGETFQVHHDTFELRLPIAVNSGLQGRVGQVKVAGEIRWQSCDDEVCDIPTSQRFELELPVADSPPVAIMGQGSELEPNAMAHFQKMTTRREPS